MADRISRKYPQPMADVISDFIKEMKLASGLNSRRVCDVWKECSGAAGYTSNSYFKDGVLTVVLNSSVARNSLGFRLKSIMEDMNEALAKDNLIVKDTPETYMVSKIVLR